MVVTVERPPPAYSPHGTFMMASQPIPYSNLNSRTFMAYQPMKSVPRYNVECNVTKQRNNDNITPTLNFPFGNLPTLPNLRPVSPVQSIDGDTDSDRKSLSPGKHFKFCFFHRMNDITCTLGNYF